MINGTLLSNMSKTSLLVILDSWQVLDELPVMLALPLLTLLLIRLPCLMVLLKPLVLLLVLAHCLVQPQQSTAGVSWQHARQASLALMRLVCWLQLQRRAALLP